jgi:hypothetical protein
MSVPTHRRIGSYSDQNALSSRPGHSILRGRVKIVVQSNVFKVSLRFDKMLYRDTRNVTPCDSDVSQVSIIIYAVLAIGDSIQQSWPHRKSREFRCHASQHLNQASRHCAVFRPSRRLSSCSVFHGVHRKVLPVPGSLALKILLQTPQRPRHLRAVALLRQHIEHRTLDSQTSAVEGPRGQEVGQDPVPVSILGHLERDC